MKNFLLGLVVGALLVGGVASAAAGATWLGLWRVTKDGATVCEAPWMWSDLREIRCD